MKLVLASGSPRRVEILSSLGLAFETMAPNVDESRHPDEAPGVYVERVARHKALAVATPGAIVIAADTAVVHEGHIMGKPGHPQEARSMLDRLQGDVHEVFTGLAVAAEDVVHTLVDVTEVRMLPMTAEEIVGYVDSGEPMDKAGAYALQERGGLWVESITGSPFTVIGLPIHLLPRLVSQTGSNLDEFTDH
jgi:septum formation protein